MRVLVAPDKFKGTLTAVEATEAIAAGWLSERRGDEVVGFPISDGGDGFGELLGHHLQAEERRVRTVDASGRALEAVWWWVPSRRMAMVESARVIGLAMLPPGRYHPFELDTFGLGAVLRAVAEARPRLCLIGIGGSATNDAGFGLARALGWRFFDGANRPIERWIDLAGLAAIRPPDRTDPGFPVRVAVDVRNPLLGGAGATRVYGPQKGIRPEDVAPAEACHRALARFMTAGRAAKTEPAKLSGAGAAGGLGFGLHVFLGAKLTPGFELFAQLTGLKRALRRFDLVLTGEGCLDATSVRMGKGVGQLALMCRAADVPCVGLAGKVEGMGKSVRPFEMVRSMTPDLTPPANALRQPAFWLEQLAARVARGEGLDA